MAAWYDVIDALRTYLRAQAEFAKAIVEAGAMDPDNYDLAVKYSTGAIFLIRDREGQDEPLGLSGRTGNMDLFIETWIRDDGPDPVDGYGKLSALEDNVTAALAAFVRQASISGLTILNMKVDETIGDTDARRPWAGSRKTVNIEWAID